MNSTKRVKLALAIICLFSTTATNPKFKLSETHRNILASHRKKLSRVTLENQVIRVGNVANRYSYSSYVTIASIYFSFNRSKHSLAEYEKWTATMLRSVSAPLVMYTSEKDAARLVSIRNSTNYPATFVIYESIWMLLRELERKRNQSYVPNYQRVQPTLDYERGHGSELYAVWNLKAYITSRTARLNPYNSDAFFYTDAGAWREKVFDNWPNVTFLRQVMSKVGHLPLFGQVSVVVLEYPRDDLVEGGWFAGTSTAIEAYERAYYTRHDERLKNKEYVGKEQIIMNEMVFGREVGKWHQRTLNSSRIMFYKIDECEDAYFLYHRYFAHARYYDCGIDRMSLIQPYDQFNLLEQ